MEVGIVLEETVQNKIYIVRGYKVMLDVDLAEMMDSFVDKEYPMIQLRIKKTRGIYHDRFIVLDYGTEEERIFLCGASSKDAGARVTCIVEDFGTGKYKGLIKELPKNQELVLV
jgi:hypothetical protein